MGVTRRADGRKYDGQWKDNKQHGKGKYTNAKGVTKEYQWEAGKRVENGVEGKAVGKKGTKKKAAKGKAKKKP